MTYTALELSALLLTLSAAAFGWVGAIIVGAGLAVAYVSHATILSMLVIGTQRPRRCRGQPPVDNG